MEQVNCVCLCEGGLKIYIDQIDSHVHMRVFFNGGLCGRLVLRTEEVRDFFDEVSLAFTSAIQHGDLPPYAFRGLLKEFKNFLRTVQRGYGSDKT